MSAFKSCCFTLMLSLLVGCATSDNLLEKGNQALAKKDYQQAMQWYLKAADKGNVNAMYNIGKLYGGGLGVETSYQQAMHWWLKAADKGNIDSMVMIGAYYSATTEYPESMQWYKKAADKGSIIAMKNVGYFYKKGIGVEKDLKKAELWNEKAENAIKIEKAKAAQQ